MMRWFLTIGFLGRWLLVLQAMVLFTCLCRVLVPLALVWILCSVWVKPGPPHLCHLASLYQYFDVCDAWNAKVAVTEIKSSKANP